MEEMKVEEDKKDAENQKPGKYSPITPMSGASSSNGRTTLPLTFSSPSRKVCIVLLLTQLHLIVTTQAKKMVNYAESDAENDDEDAFGPLKSTNTRGRALKRRKTVVHDEDDFLGNSESDMFDDGMIRL